MFETYLDNLAEKYGLHSIPVQPDEVAARRDSKKNREKGEKGGEETGETEGKQRRREGEQSR